MISWIALACRDDRQAFFLFPQGCVSGRCGVGVKYQVFCIVYP